MIIMAAALWYYTAHHFNPYDQDSVYINSSGTIATDTGKYDSTEGPYSTQQECEAARHKDNPDAANYPTPVPTPTPTTPLQPNDHNLTAIYPDVSFGPYIASTGQCTIIMTPVIYDQDLVNSVNGMLESAKASK